MWVKLLLEVHIKNEVGPCETQKWLIFKQGMSSIFTEIYDVFRCIMGRNFTFV